MEVLTYFLVGLFVENVEAFSGTKVWHSNDKYRSVVWQCNDKYRGKEICKSTHLTEDEINKAIIAAINKIIVEKDEIIDNCQLILNEVLDTEELKEKEAGQLKELNLVSKQIENLVESNSTIIQNPDEFNGEYNYLSSKYFAIH